MTRIFTFLLLVIAVALQATWIGSLAYASDDRQDSKSISPTYGETLQWLQDEDKFPSLFAIGDLRVQDLLTACLDKREEIAEPAVTMLHLLGSSRILECPVRFDEQRQPVFLLSSDAITENDFVSLEQVLRVQPCEKVKNCKEADLPPIDDSVMYALMLDGSPRAASLLERIYALGMASGASDTNAAEVAEQPKDLIEKVKKLGHDLKFEANTFENVVRNSAFFIPDEYRADAEVELLARNSKDDRLLVSVSYTCGSLCGRGCLAALRKDGAVWQYATIKMWWIS